MTSFYLLVGSALLLLVVGLVMVLSASSIDSFVANGSAFTVFLKQVKWAVLGLCAFWVAMLIRPHWYRYLAYPFLIPAVIMLAALLVNPAWGVGDHGRWLAVGPIQFQPSELAKLALVLWGADILVRKQHLLVEWRQLAIPFLPVAGIVLLLVGANDLGTMMCLLMVVAGLLWVSGVRFRLLAALGGLSLVAVVMLIGSRSYRLERVTNFLDPFADKDDAGHQSVQGLYALSTGGWWGVGLGQSRGKWEYLPEAHNDFIFAIIGEELGIIGAMMVIALYGVLAYAGLRIARRVADPFQRLAAASCTIWLAGQAFINMAQVAGLLPVTGIPLPLISAGGSSLVLTMFVVGILACFARAEPAAAAALHARGPNWISRITRIPLPPLPGTSPGKSALTGRVRKPAKVTASSSGKRNNGDRVSTVGRTLTKSSPRPQARTNGVPSPPGGRK